MLLAKSAKIKQYEQRITQYRQNLLFDQIKDYGKLNGELDGDSVIPDAEESKSLWDGIWGGGVENEHNRTADWLKGLKGERGYDQQEALEISEVMVKKQCKKFTNWKAPG